MYLSTIRSNSVLIKANKIYKRSIYLTSGEIEFYMYKFSVDTIDNIVSTAEYIQCFAEFDLGERFITNKKLCR